MPRDGQQYGIVGLDKTIGLQPVAERGQFGCDNSLHEMKAQGFHFSGSIPLIYFLAYVWTLTSNYFLWLLLFTRSTAFMMTFEFGWPSFIPFLLSLPTWASP